MAPRRMRTRDLLTFGLAAVVVLAIVGFNLFSPHRSSADTSLGNLAASWQTYGGLCGSQSGTGHLSGSPCPQINVEIFKSGSYKVTTLFGTNGDANGTLTAAQATLLAQARANVVLPTTAPADCGSFVTVQHVKITVVANDGTIHRLDTCVADAPSSPVVRLLQGLAPSGG